MTDNTPAVESDIKSSLIDRNEVGGSLGFIDLSDINQRKETERNRISRMSVDEQIGQPPKISSGPIIRGIMSFDR